MLSFCGKMYIFISLPPIFLKYLTERRLFRICIVHRAGPPKNRITLSYVMLCIRVIVRLVLIHPASTCIHIDAAQNLVNKRRKGLKKEISLLHILFWPCTAFIRYTWPFFTYQYSCSHSRKEQTYNGKNRNSCCMFVKQRS